MTIKETLLAMICACSGGGDQKPMPIPDEEVVHGKHGAPGEDGEDGQNGGNGGNGGDAQ